MRPLDRIRSRDSEPPQLAGERPSAEIIWLDDWRRRRRRRPSWRSRRAPPKPLPGPPVDESVPPRPHRIPIEAWLMILVVFSALAGATFALMGLGYLP